MVQSSGKKVLLKHLWPVTMTRKGLRQATMAKDKTSDTLSLVSPAAPAPVGANEGRTTATPPAFTTPGAAN